MVTMKEALSAKQEMKEILKGVSGITGIGITWDEKGQPCVRVNIDVSISRHDRNKIPSEVGGVPVCVETVSGIQMEHDSVNKGCKTQ